MNLVVDAMSQSHLTDLVISHAQMFGHNRTGRVIVGRNPTTDLVTFHLVHVSIQNGSPHRTSLSQSHLTDLVISDWASLRTTSFP